MLTWLKGLFSGEDKPNTSSVSASNSVDALSKADSVSSCLNVYVNAPIGSTLESRTIDKLLKIARTFSEWFLVYENVSPDSKLAKTAVEKLKEYAKSFSDWSKIFTVESVDSVFLEQVLMKMVDTAKTKSDWMQVLSFSADSRIKQPNTAFSRAEIELQKLPQNFSDWNSLLEETARGSQFRSSVLVQAITVAKKPVDFIDLMRSVGEDDESDRKIMDALKNVVADFESWKEAFDAELNDDSVEFALSKMAETATSFAHWSSVYDVAEERGQTSILDKAAGALSGADASFDDWKSLFDRIDEGSDFETSVAQKAVDAAKSLDQLIEIYTDAGESSKAEEIILNAIKVRKDNFRSWSSVYDQDVSGTISDLAFGKMAELANDFDLISEIAEYADGDDDRLKQLCSAFDRIEWNKADLFKVFDDESCPSTLQDHALQHLYSLCLSVPDLIKLHLLMGDKELSPPDSLESDIFNRIVEIATQGELEIISLLEEEGSDLRDKAERALSKKVR